MISVSKIELRNVTVHGTFVLNLPKCGVVLVTGPNGSGKSTIVEGVSVGLWGEPLRGKSVWTEQPGQIVVHTHGGTRVDRRRSGAKNSLQYTVEGVPSNATYDTATKAQEALDSLIGPYEIWRRSCAFSSRDSAHFTESTDAERKRLLESLLGLEKLDAASALERKDLHKVEAQVQKTEQKAQMLEQRAELLSRQLSEDRQLLRGLQQPGAPEEVPGLTTRRAALESELRKERTHKAELDREIGKLQGQDELNKANYVKLASYSTCPTCGQVVTNQHKTHAAQLSSELGFDLRYALETLQAQLKTAQACTYATEKKLDRVRTQLAEEQAKVSAYNEYDRTRTRLEQALVTRRQELEKLEDEQDALSTSLHAVREQLEVLQHTDKVLSPRGVRAHLLHNALAFIEGVSNTWLARLGLQGLKLHLTPYAEKAAGGLRDVIGLEVEGAGGGNGYKGASGGERRRIDVALMLALGEVARISSGTQEQGTLFLDEVTDALDPDGIDAVCDCINDLAKTRCVVVISHREDVVRGLRNVHEHVRLERSRERQAGEADG